MKVALYGPPAAGKTSIGCALAVRLGVPFVDTDKVVEQRSGMTITEIFALRGEAGFRTIEAEVCSELAAAQGGIVMALGGGSLLDPWTRSVVERRCAVVLVDARFEDLAQRLGQNGSRPLVAGPDPERRLEDLLRARRAHYDSFPARLETSRQTVEQAAAAAAALLCRRSLRVRRPECEQTIELGYGVLENLQDMLSARRIGGPLAIVTDENVNRSLGSRLPRSIPPVVIPPGEDQKTLGSVERVCDELATAGLDRGGTLIAVGGGVVGDLVGFAASVFMRGISWVDVPTSLLAMVDASIGGKTAVDLPAGKNLAGRFHPPALVVSDPLALATLPERERRSGLAEVVKHAVIGDPALFARLEAGTSFGSLPDIAAAVSVKVRIVEWDPLEQDTRATLNFGHTIGHALETASRYALSHGEAVAIGMVAEARLAERVGVAQLGLAERIRHVLEVHGLPTVYTGLDAASLRALMRVDKKKAGNTLRFALPAHIGRVVHGIEVDEGLLAETLTGLAAG
ncbi:MAG: 3-dehydroquinate synthase [Vicinamibacterales bacterium]